MHDVDKNSLSHYSQNYIFVSGKLHAFVGVSVCKI